MKHSLFHAILWSVLAVIVTAFVSAGMISDYLGSRQVVRQRTASLGQMAAVMVPQVLSAVTGEANTQLSQDLAVRLGSASQSRVTLIRSDGVVIGDSEQTLATMETMDNHAMRPEVATALKGREGSSLRYSSTLGADLLYVALPVKDGGELIGVLRIAIPLKEVRQLRAAIRQIVGVSVGIGLLVAIALGLWVARRLTRPIIKMREVAIAIAGGRFDAKAPPTSIREAHELGEALNTMGDSLRQYVHRLASERNQARAIVESMAEGVVALDANDRILLMNSAAAALFQAGADHAEGRALVDTIRQPDVIELVKKSRDHREQASRDVTVYQPSERTLRVHAVPCGSMAPEGPHTVVVIQDLTDLYRYDRLRKEFVANVSHELKSPLTAIRGLTETLLDGAVNDASNNTRFVRLIDEEAARLGRLIEDLLELAQIEAGAAPGPQTPVDLESLVNGLTASLRTALEQRRIQMNVSLGGTPSIRGNADRLKQVFVNLIDNAIKYNREGGTISITAHADSGTVRVCVSDTGIGIPEEDLSRIFERFYRVDKARSRELGGTGLGLSIVKHIVEAHGGQVSVTSRPHEGSAFTFTLPAAV